MEGLSRGLMASTMQEKMNGLFACDVAHYINIPQIVVVGHQSSGKSSGLHGLTGLPFPRDSELCTRFATQIIFRRAKEESIVAFIVPAEDASAEHQAGVRGWRKELQVLDSPVFASIISEVPKSILACQLLSWLTSLRPLPLWVLPQLMAKPLGARSPRMC
ncbi:hypothetical protein ANO14919_088470 [Xylariales sp. No.14919]|nr:hypothetical protein ANO14919_088470 [Xylariales sp. No.14919]